MADRQEGISAPDGWKAIVGLLALTLVVSPGAAAAPTLTEVTYKGPVNMTGDAALDCEAAHLGLLPSTSTPVFLDTSAAYWQVLTLRQGHMLTDGPTSGPSAITVVETADAPAPPRALPAGNLSLHVLPGGSLQAFPAETTAPERLLADAVSPELRFTVGVEGERVQWSAPLADASLPSHAVPDEQDPTLPPDAPRTVVGRNPVVEGHTRPLVGEGLVSWSGTTVLHITNAVVWLNNGTRTAVGTEDAVESPDSVPVGATQRVVQEGWLWFQGLGVINESVATSASCGTIAGTIHGEVSWRGVTTMAPRTDSTPRVVTVRGDLDVVDDILTNGGAASTQYGGSVALVAHDLTVVSVAAAGTVVAALLLLASAWTILRHLVVPGWMLLYSRIREDALLDHPLRELLHRYIENNPGANPAGAAQDLEISRSVVRYHLRLLESGGLIRRHRLSGETFLTVHGHEDDVRRLIAASKPPAAFIVERTQDERVLRRELVTDMCAHFGFSETAARKWLQRTEKLGIIDAEGRGHGVTYRCRL